MGNAGTEQGMHDTFGSTCHGAGRARSRNSSRNKLDYQEVLDALKTKGIAIRVASPKLVMEEAPESYKVSGCCTPCCCMAQSAWRCEGRGGGGEIDCIPVLAVTGQRQTGACMILVYPGVQSYHRLVLTRCLFGNYVQQRYGFVMCSVQRYVSTDPCRADWSQSRCKTKRDVQCPAGCD